MRIKWEWSLDLEAHRIVDIARYVGNGFFALHGFLPLPSPSNSKYLHDGVYLPNLDFAHMPSFWAQAAKFPDLAQSHTSSPILIDQIRSMLIPLNLSPLKLSKIENIAPVLINQVDEFLKQFVRSATIPANICIHPTYFGTVGSFFYEKETDTIVIFLRKDQGIKTLIECYLTQILRPSAVKDLNGDWAETEFLVDWIINSSSLSNILPEDKTWTGTIQSTRNNNTSSLTQDSINFLKKLGVTTSDKPKFSVKNSEIYYHDTLLSHLTSREISLLTAMIKISPFPLSYDAIGNILFSSEEKFSLAAISKTIERLRSKFDSLGISRHHITTASTLGYYLKN